MSMVRFATICDKEGCGRRSEEYSRWLHCDECMGDVCPDHMEAGTGDDETGQCLCKDCAKSLLAEA